MIKIKVSYERPEELEKLLKMLGTAVKKCKVSRQQGVKYLKAYVDIDT